MGLELSFLMIFPMPTSLFGTLLVKVIIEKSHDEVSLMEQDTIENVS